MDIDESKPIIDVKDYRGERVILTHKKWEEKSTIHPELKKETFLKNLRKTIDDPEEVWQDNSDKRHKQCYYRKYSTNSYVKAVIWIASDPCVVVSAFETNKIKETIYPDLKRIK